MNERLTPDFALSTLDLCIVGVYLVAILLHGWWAGRNARTANDYFLAGRALPWYLIGMSLYASNMSGSSFIGLMGASYEYGMVVFNYEWTATLVLIFFAFFMLPYFLKAEITTIPGFLERRFDHRSRLAFSLFTIVAIIFIDTAGALYAGGLVIHKLVPQIELWQAVLALGLASGFYTLLGGLTAAVITDFVQGVLLIVGSAIIFWIAFDKVGGWDGFTSRIAPEKLGLIKPADDNFLPWPGIGGVILLGIYYWTLNQFLAQPTLGSRSLEDGRKGALLAGFLKIPNIFLMILPGLFALVLYPDLPSADMAFPTLAMDLLPSGLKGLVMVGLIAAIMSSLDSALNASATLITIDFVKKARPRLTGEQLMQVGRYLTGLIMVIGIAYAPFIANFETLFDYVQSALAFIIPSVVAVYLGGIFSRRVTSGAAFWVILGGLVVGVTLFLTQRVFRVWGDWGLPELHYTYMAVILFVISLVAMFVISAFTRDRKAPDQLVFHIGHFLHSYRGYRASWYKNAYYQAVALAALMIAAILWLW